MTSKIECRLCGELDYLLPDNVCESCALTEEKNYIRKQELGLS